ncbi:WecB/TagA/CpsF family glycosyltransferase [Lacticaseibacillus pabuli]|uniref:N-acetylglucosaminyldiphosphoundecaprenol N-acetyl-beta-D-mannosaminyltransferase n=1 Tax=Lacticaseibacillus pabuli TaxID=3025672 RepID=A0ABY7WWV8_9LACO|nr:WecB/TagA/CpsF family glycosyltransferase [Lacticaseibacillus sp. KACC 23028]WDF83437.1 WecB/TagA/CpsF family glycosyltransferase [Lacticaseibacillus sp. KACC 23028]
MTKVDVLGVDFDAYTMAEFMQRIKERYQDDKGSFIVTANPEIVMYAREHPDYAQLIDHDADFVTADGIGVVKGAAMLGTPLPERVTGFDLMQELLGWANAQHLSVYLIGAKADVNKAAVAKVQERFPQLTIAGARDGYFDLKDTSVAQVVIDSGADVVFAALGFPKQEYFLKRIKAARPHTILMGVGGSFDVLSGTVKRAPKWVQRLSLEWLYRLAKNPSRFGRMMVLPRFLAAVRKNK